MKTIRKFRLPPHAGQLDALVQHVSNVAGYLVGAAEGRLRCLEGVGAGVGKVCVGCAANTTKFNIHITKC